MPAVHSKDVENRDFQTEARESLVEAAYDLKFLADNFAQLLGKPAAKVREAAVGLGKFA
jgi:hypothetical protein